MADDRLTLRSYRRVFRFERRIYRIERWVIPIPGGLPLRAVGYFLAALLAVLALSALPLLGWPLEALGWQYRYLAIPTVVAALGSQVAPDGRSAHRFACSWLALRLRARRRCADRAVPLEGEPVPSGATLPLRPDERAPRLRRAQVRGPADVRLGEPLEIRRRRRRLVARPPARRGRPGALLDAIEVPAGDVLEIRP